MITHIVFIVDLSFPFREGIAAIKEVSEKMKSQLPSAEEDSLTSSRHVRLHTCMHV